MADNSFKINKSVNFNPQPGLPANPMDGDFFYDSVAQSFVHYHNGFWTNFESVGTVAAITDITAAQMTPAIVRNSVVRITGVGVFPHLCGLAASYSAKTISIYNASDHWISVEYNSSAEPTANNRILTPTLGSMNIVEGEIATFTYDIIQNRWLLVSISSQSGAQVPATITSNGLVSLHQASATPWEPIVFTDGDYNTATGFVGLDANRAAMIAAPLASVTALEITSATNASALIINGAAGGTAVGISAGAGNIGLQINGVTGAAALAVFGSGANGLGGAFYGAGFGAGVIMQGSTSSPGGKALSTSNYAALVATGNAGTELLDLHLTNGLVAFIANAGGAGGDAIVAKGIGTGYAGIHTYGGVNGHGIIAETGSGTGYAGIFNGRVNMSSSLDVIGATTVGSLTVTAVGGITTTDGFTVAATTANTSTTGTLGSVGMLSVDTSNAFDGTWTTTSKSLHFGGTTSEGIGSKRTATGNQFGLDFYTNSLSRMNITNAGLVTVANDLTVVGTLTVNAINSATTLSAVQDIIVDSGSNFDGSFTTGAVDNLLRFGAALSGQGIGSKRTAGGNQFGLDFYTGASSRMAITSAGAITTTGSLGVGTSLSTGTSLTVGTFLTANNLANFVQDAIIDSSGVYNGVFTSGTNNNLLRFGSSTTGEGIGSKRTSGGNQFGLDIYTNYVSRISIANAGLITMTSDVTMNSDLTVSGSIFTNDIFTTGGVITLHTTTNFTNNIDVAAQLYAGSSGGSYCHIFNNNGNVPPISLTGARDPIGVGDGNGGFWFGATENLSTGSGTAWRLNIIIGGNIYRFNVDSIVALT